MKAVTLGIFLLPFTSLNLLPSDYRPISIFFIILPGMVFLFRSFIYTESLPKDEFYLILFLLMTYIQSVVMICVGYGDYERFLRYIPVIIIGILSYFAFKYWFLRNGIDKTIRIIYISYIFVAIVGIIEFLSLFGYISPTFKQYIGEIFSGKVTSRLQLVTSEPSWAAKILIFGLPFLLYGKNRLKLPLIKILLFCMGLLFVLTFSLEGLLILLSGLMLYLILSYRTVLFSKRNLLKIVSLILISSLIIFAIFHFLSIEGTYLINRVTKIINQDNIYLAMNYDSSLFIRYAYPMVGFKMFFSHPLGVGLGGYGLHFNEFIDDFGVNYSSFQEVVDDSSLLTADPKSLYAKVLSENGLLSGWAFFAFIYIHLKQLLSLPRRSDSKDIIRLARLNFAFALTLVIQFGSFAFLPFWFLLSFNTALYQNT